jgi:hypothetical protein
MISSSTTSLFELTEGMSNAVCLLGYLDGVVVQQLCLTGRDDLASHMIERHAIQILLQRLDIEVGD